MVLTMLSDATHPLFSDQQLMELEIAAVESIYVDVASTCLKIFSSLHEASEPHVTINSFCHLNVVKSANIKANIKFSNRYMAWKLLSD